MNFFKHHMGDYDSSTAHLTWDEDMAYTRLLRAYYRREQPIPCGATLRLVRASSKAQKAAVDSVLLEFFTQVDGNWHNKRADEEIAAYQAQCAHNRVAGNLGGRPKKTTVVPENNHSGSLRVPENKPLCNPNQYQIPEPERSKEAALPPDPLWGEGLGILTASGVTVESARTFIGKCLKDWPADAVLDALRESRGVAEPKAYATKLLQGKTRKPGRQSDYTRGAV